MGYRLSGKMDDRSFERLLSGERQLVGASAECDVLLGHLSVSRCHAEIVVLEEGVEIVDLGSLNGTFVDGERIATTVVREGSQLRFGQIELQLERVEEVDAEVGVDLPVTSVSVRVGQRSDARISTRAVETFAIEELPGLLFRLREGQGVTQISLAIGHSLLESLPIAKLEVRSGEGGSEGILFRGKQGNGNSLEVLERYAWPGNIRQLKNEMARAVAFVADGGLLDSERLSPEVLAGHEDEACTALSDRLRLFERREISNALRLFEWDVGQAAESLGILLSTLYRRMKTLEVGADPKD